MLKRILDFLFAIFFLLLLSPVFIVIGILIKLDSAGSIFFRQKRVGLNGKDFYIYKFRSMKNAIGPQVTSAGDQRITKIGKTIRKFKLDEIPQLINIIKGDMSFVGPRPEVREFVEMFEGDFQEILKVRPGITDWASMQFIDEELILANSANPKKTYIENVLPQKIELQKKYARTRTLKEDFYLGFATVAKIFKDKN